MVDDEAFAGSPQPMVECNILTDMAVETCFVTTGSKHVRATCKRLSTRLALLSRRDFSTTAGLGLGKLASRPVRFGPRI